MEREEKKETQKQGPQNVQTRRPRWIAGAAVLLLAAAGIGIFGIRADQVTVDGNERFSQQQIQSDLFSGKTSESMAVLFWRQLTGQNKEIPYLNAYSIAWENAHTVAVRVEERAIFGCLDVGGVYIYIDETGMVLGSGEEKAEHVPILEGIYVTQAVLYETIQSDQIENLEEMEHVLRVLRQKDVEPDVLYYSAKKTIRIDLGQIRVLLGTHEDLEEKINTLVSILPQLEGLSGRLYLEELHDSNSFGYRFEQNM